MSGTDAPPYAAYSLSGTATSGHKVQFGDFGLDTTPQTAVGWALFNQTNSSQFIYAAGVVADWNFGIYGSSGAKICASRVDNAATPVQINACSTTSYTASAWDHTAATYSGGVELKVYLNGVNETTLTTGASGLRVAGASQLGAIESVNNNISGRITEVAIFNAVLTSTDISTIMNFGLEGTYSPVSGAILRNSIIRNSIIR